MLIKLSAVLFFLANCNAELGNQRWDVAVAVNNEIKLLNHSGSLLGTASEQFTKLKALSYDYVLQHFLASDVNGQNDTIYRMQFINDHLNIEPVVKNLPDDVQGLAVDPSTHILYWTDSENRSINYISLKNPLGESSKNLFYFQEDKPHDIAIDACQRYIYWTNLDITKPSIARSSLSTPNQEILVSEDLYTPTGIAIDYENDRIYWADMRQGIYFRIESTKMDGSERKILFEGTHQKPFGVAVDSDYVYWTDTINNELNRKAKNSDAPPEVIHKFDAVPRGIVVHDTSFLQLDTCAQVLNAIDSFKGVNYTNPDDQITNSKACSFHGEYAYGGCWCHKGYTGLNCEISLCYNFCVHGECHFGSLAYPQCKCPPGFMGKRCQRNVCDGFCLNDGKCSLERNNSNNPTCKCPNGFTGVRCEDSSEFSKICESFCSGRRSSSLLDEQSEMLCKCQDGGFSMVESSARSQHLKQSSAWEYAEKPAILVLSICMLIMFALIVVLSTFVCKLRRRPRIKKRIIVNKNVTPLTYRPQPSTEQCEITIENCCNMNVCETPCFEPPQLRGFHSKKEEKKDLLGNMENGDDLY